MFRNIKSIAVLLGCFSLLIVACKKYEGDSYDFSDKEKHYIRFADRTPLEFNEALEDSLGDEYYPFEEQSVVVEVRQVFTEDITYKYSVDLDGNVSTHTGVIPRGKNSSEIILGFDEDAFTDSVDVIAGKIQLLEASAPNYGELRIGYPKEGNQVINFIVNRPVELPE